MITPSCSAFPQHAESQTASTRARSRTVLAAMALATTLFASGCTTITVAGAAIGIAATAASTAVDVAVGTAKVGAKVGGKAVDLVVGDEE